MTTQAGIWKYSNYLLPPVKPKFRITLAEGNTSLITLDNLNFKREDQNPTGSVKDRGIAYQLSALIQQGNHQFTISSSGNAAISAAEYSQKAKINLTIFVSPKIATNKLRKLNSYPFKIIKTHHSISQAHQYAKQNSAYNLRPSKDQLGPVGYQTIAYELVSQLKSLPDALFIPTSSGTMLIGIFQGFNQLIRDRQIDKLPKFFAIQTTTCHPIAKYYDTQFKPEKSSLASAIVAKIIPRKKQIQTILNSTQGGALIVSNHQIKIAQQWLKDHHITTSYEGAAALAGYYKYQQINFQINYPIILLTGSL